MRTGLAGGAVLAVALNGDPTLDRRGGGRSTCHGVASYERGISGGPLSWTCRAGMARFQRGSLCMQFRTAVSVAFPLKVSPARQVLAT